MAKAKYYLKIYTFDIVRKETCCRHIGYSYRLTARVLLYAPSHRQDNTYHSLCYTSRGALAGTRNSSMGKLYDGTLNGIRTAGIQYECFINFGKTFISCFITLVCQTTEDCAGSDASEGRKEGRKKTFYLTTQRRTQHMVKDHSDSERKPAAATWDTLSD